jgi:hypothetical protein
LPLLLLCLLSRCLGRSRCSPSEAASLSLPELLSYWAAAASSLARSASDMVIYHRSSASHAAPPTGATPNHHTHLFMVVCYPQSSTMSGERQHKLKASCHNITPCDLAV